MWYNERKDKSRNTTIPKFQLCCGGGKVQLPLLDPPPQLLQDLLDGNQSPGSKNYQANIRTYNAMFSFTSPGMKMDNDINNGRGPPILRMQGQACHRIGSMLPLPGESPKYAQLYIFDTENEISNRMKTYRYNINMFIINFLKFQLMDKISYCLTGLNFCGYIDQTKTLMKIL